MASKAHFSSTHRKPVGMRRMQSGNTLMEGAAVARQIAKKEKKRRELQIDKERVGK